MIKIIVMILSSFFLLSCSEQKSVEANKDVQSESEKVVRYMDEQQIKRGRQLYLKNCTVCHGINGEGSPDWRKRNADGTFPPPPLNGTGHAWHHPQKVLVDVIKNGTAKLGGKMPAWKDRLTDQEINDIIAWFKSQWPDELYQAWKRMDQGSRLRNK